MDEIDYEIHILKELISKMIRSCKCMNPKSFKVIFNQILAHVSKLKNNWAFISKCGIFFYEGIVAIHSKNFKQLVPLSKHQIENLLHCIGYIQINPNDAISKLDLKTRHQVTNRDWKFLILDNGRNNLPPEPDIEESFLRRPKIEIPSPYDY